MKKTIVLILLVACAMPMFADDAMVLPAGVIRAYIAPTYGFADKAFDVDGKSQDLVDFMGADKVTFVNLGFAVEYGVTDWLSAAVQWVPGWTFYSLLDVSGAPMDLNANGFFDLFAGAKIQVLGEKGLVENKTVRLAFAPGIKIPMPDADWDKQADNLNANKDATFQAMDKHAWGVGSRAFFDYVVNDMFYVNLFAEYIYYLERKDAEFLAFTPAAVVAKADIGYGYDLTLEVEPHFVTMLSEGVQFEASLPINYTMAPDMKINGDTQKDTANSLLSIRPSVSLFLMKFFVPLELKLTYSLPVYGVNSPAMNSLTAQVKMYLKF